MSLHDPFDNSPAVAITPSLSTAYDNTQPFGVSGGTIPKDDVPCSVVFTTNRNLASSLAGVVNDGYTIVQSDSVLLMGQTDPTQNGIYTAEAGAPNRHPGFNASAEFYTGLVVVIMNGSANLGKRFNFVSQPPFTLGISNVLFEEDKAFPRTV